MPKQPPIPLPDLCDLENLRASGLTDETIRDNRLRTEHDPTRLAALLNRRAGSNGSFAGLVFTYRDLAGKDNEFARVRPHVPRVEGGKAVKYEQPIGSGLRAYLPTASLPGLRDGQSSVYLTEGEKKALALSQLGVDAVGIGGIWCGCQKRDDGGYELIPDLAAIPWADRVVYIIFDHDQKATTRRDAAAARDRLARALTAAGAREVYGVDLPGGPGGTKQGVDDFLVANGEDAFQALVENATSLPGHPGGNSFIHLIPSTLPVLGRDAYHGIIGEFLDLVSPQTEATDACILAHLIPAIGTVIGPQLYCWSGSPQPARFNTAVVGPTAAGRKGTGAVPVGQLMKLAVPDFWSGQPAKGLSSGEGLIVRVADKVEQGESGRGQIVPVEKRLYVLEPEFSKVLAQTRRESNILSHIMREAFDSGNLSTLTVTPRHAVGAHISITGHITPRELAKRFTEIEMANGFGNRFLWFYSKSDKRLPNAEPVDSASLTQFADRLKRVLKFSEELTTGGGKLVVKRDTRVTMDEEAKRLWEIEYSRLVWDRTDLVGELTARGSSHVVRLALLYALLDCQEVIRSVHLRAALAVWSYNVASIECLFGDKTSDSLAVKLYRLLSKNGPLRTSEFHSHTGSKGQEIQTALEQLERAGSITRTKLATGKSGRPAEVWRIVS